jgi:cell division septal protein FtsQ
VSTKPRQQLRARVAVLPLPAPSRLALVVPSGRSLVTGLVLAAACALAYAGARETSVFAVRTVVVSGAPPPLAGKVRRALLPLDGTSLVALHESDIESLATALPQVESVTYDRAFPHTLRVFVQPEQPLAVLRSGASSWLIARTGRVVERLPPHGLPSLPRIWQPRSVAVVVGSPLAVGAGAAEVAALAPVAAAGLRGRVATVKVDGTQITYVLRGGIELRVGRAANLPLKLAISRRILGTAPIAGYLDVSVPERPVAGPNPQVSG